MMGRSLTTVSNWKSRHRHNPWIINKAHIYISNIRKISKAIYGCQKQLVLDLHTRTHMFFTGVCYGLLFSFVILPVQMPQSYFSMYNVYLAATVQQILHSQNINLPRKDLNLDTHFGAERHKYVT